MTARISPVVPEKKYRFITIRQGVDKIAETQDGGLERHGEMFKDKPVYRIYNNRSDAQLGILSFYQPWKQYVFSSQPECVFNDACLRDVLDFLSKTVVILALLLTLPILAHAQQPNPQVAQCIAGVYDECRLVGGHWYYRKAQIWTRDDGQVGQPPMVVATCPAIAQTEKPRRFDFTFLRDPRFYTGVGFSFAVTGYDISTSHGQEATRFYRNDAGQLNRGKYLGITALTNVALLPLDMQPNHKWRWVAFGMRVGLASWRLKSAIHNGAGTR